MGMIVAVLCIICVVSSQPLPPEPNPIYLTPTQQSGDVNELVYLASVSKLFVANHPLGAGLWTADTTFPCKMQHDGFLLEKVLAGNVYINNKGDYNLDGQTVAVVPNGPPHVVANTIGNATLTTLDPLAGVKFFAKQFAVNVKIWWGKLKFDNPFKEQDTPIDGRIYPLVINDNLIDVKFTAAGVELFPTIPGYTLKSTVTPCNTAGCSSVSATLDPTDNYTVIASGTFNPVDYLLIQTVPIVDPERVFRSIFKQEIRKLGVIHVEAVYAEATNAANRPDLGKPLPTKPYSEVLKLILKVSNNLQANYLHLVHYGTFTAAIGALNDYYRSLYPSWTDFVSFSGNNNQETPALVYQFVSGLQSKPYFTTIYNACPIVGVDGTLKDTPVPPVLVGRVSVKGGSFAEGDDTGTYILLSEGEAGWVRTNDNQLKPFYYVFPRYYLMTIADYEAQPTLLYSNIELLDAKLFDAVAQLFFPSSSGSQ